MYIKFTESMIVPPKPTAGGFGRIGSRVQQRTQRKLPVRQPNGQLSRKKPSKYQAFDLAWLGEGVRSRSVYVFQASDGSTKLGMAYNPADRCRWVQSGNPRTVRIFWVARALASSAGKLELAAHKKFAGSDYCREGDWYDHAPETLVALVQNLAQEMKIELRDDPFHRRG